MEQSACRKERNNSSLPAVDDQKAGFQRCVEVQGRSEEGAEAELIGQSLDEVKYIQPGQPLLSYSRTLFLSNLVDSELQLRCCGAGTASKAPATGAHWER